MQTRIPSLPTNVVVHPLVLLSVVDHYNRVAKDTDKRVVGILLGETRKGSVDITNSYAVPFEEGDAAEKIFFIDLNYHENMFAMLKKVNARERVVGWYSTGPKIKPADIDIHELLRKYHPNPCFVIIDVEPKTHGLPTEAYCSIEEVKEDGSETSRTFVHIASELGALEAEEIGVEHLLRDVKDTSVTTLSQQVTNQVASLKGLFSRLQDIKVYLTNVADGKMPLNHEIMNNLQNIFNLLPNLAVDELIKAFAVKTNDMMLVVYLSSLIRSVIALHNLVNNKLTNKEAEAASLAPAAAPPAPPAAAAAAAPTS